VKAQLLAALQDAGGSEDDYRDIERARRIIDKVNARLAANDAALTVAIMVTPAHSTRPIWPSGEIREA